MYLFIYECNALRFDDCTLVVRLWNVVFIASFDDDDDDDDARATKAVYNNNNNIIWDRKCLEFY